MARVLIVEDNRDLADTLVFLLEASDHQVRAVHSGPEALRELEQWPAHCVVLDIALPCMDGMEVAKHIRERYGRAIRVIGCTAYEPTELQPSDACFDALLIKPVTVDKLLSSVGKAAGKRRQPGQPRLREMNGMRA